MERFHRNCGSSKLGYSKEEKRKKKEERNWLCIVKITLYGKIGGVSQELWQLKAAAAHSEKPLFHIPKSALFKGDISQELRQLKAAAAHSEKSYI